MERNGFGKNLRIGPSCASGIGQQEKNSFQGCSCATGQGKPSLPLVPEIIFF
jgi:hypothetical protein